MPTQTACRNRAGPAEPVRAATRPPWIGACARHTRPSAAPRAAGGGGGVEAVRGVPAGLPALRGDPDQLHRPLANLVTSARQAPEGRAWPAGGEPGRDGGCVGAQRRGAPGRPPVSALARRPRHHRGRRARAPRLHAEARGTAADGGRWSWRAAGDRARFGFTDDQIRPYTFNIQSFLADCGAVRQGFLDRRPPARMVEERGGVVQRSVDVSIEGWAQDMAGRDVAGANAPIKRDDPEMTDERLAYAPRVMNERGIVVSGDAERRASAR